MLAGKGLGIEDFSQPGSRHQCLSAPDFDDAPVKASHCDDADDEPFLPPRVNAVRLFRSRRTIFGRCQHAFLRDTRKFLFGFYGGSGCGGPHIVDNDQKSTSKAPLSLLLLSQPKCRGHLETAGLA